MQIYHVRDTDMPKITKKVKVYQLKVLYNEFVRVVDGPKVEKTEQKLK